MFTVKNQYFIIFDIDKNIRVLLCWQITVADELLKFPSFWPISFLFQFHQSVHVLTKPEKNILYCMCLS